MNIIIVAGGSGVRMGSSVPKQFLPLGTKPILMHTVECFFRFNNQINIILVLPEDQIDYWHDLCAKYNFYLPHTVVVGGSTRYLSVKNGLTKVDKGGLVGVHDGVRPLVSQDTIRRCFSEAETYGSAVPVMPSSESVRILDADGRSRAVNRAAVRMVQTPQVFRSEVIKKAYLTPYSDMFTDDASVVEAAGFDVHLTDGNPENIKITTPDDLVYAEMLLCKM